MKIDTYRRRGMERGVAVYDPWPDVNVGDTIEELTGNRPWEAEDGTLSIELETSREARAVAAYLKAYYTDHLAPA